jgi:hypothetical protein
MAMVSDAFKAYCEHLYAEGARDDAAFRASLARAKVDLKEFYGQLAQQQKDEEITSWVKRGTPTLDPSRTRATDSE